jgi:hypothetical protein
MIRDCVRAPCILTAFSDNTAALPVVARPAAGPLGLRWLGARGRPADSLSRSRAGRLDWELVAYHAVLFACGIAIGLFAGGYVGFIQAATPAVDAPGSYAQLATSDVQWVAMVRQSGSMAGVRLGSATERQALPGMQQPAKWLARFDAQLVSAGPVSSTHGFVRLDRSAAGDGR